ncbi:MAG: A/G-specific adenine glycosylase [Terriglobia bacterium]
MISRDRLRRSLLRWYRVKARPLPWRGTKDAYAIWVSEVMLQQTQIRTVIPYYQRFLRIFPDVETLARARFETVARLWSGLGYYRRARHMHRAAQEMVERFKGRFPEQYQEARTLSGVGHYTACAVLSIAYNQPLPVLDGNVARVVARLNAWRGNLYQSAFRRRVERHLRCLLAPRRPGDFNQALMELGQTLCLPRAPRCFACPLRKACKAFEENSPQLYPKPRARRPTERRHLATAIILRGKKAALIRGLDEGLLSDLWNFPAAFGTSRKQAVTNLETKLAGYGGSGARVRESAGSLRHNITFRSIQVTLHPADLPGARGAFRWFSLDDLERAPVSRLTRKIAHVLSQAPREHYEALK